jgi:hypothetical protein
VCLVGQLDQGSLKSGNGAAAEGAVMSMLVAIWCVPVAITEPVVCSSHVAVCTASMHGSPGRVMHCFRSGIQQNVTWKL